MRKAVRNRRALLARRRKRRIEGVLGKTARRFGKAERGRVLAAFDKLPASRFPKTRTRAAGPEVRLTDAIFHQGAEAEAARDAFLADTTRAVSVGIDDALSMLGSDAAFNVHDPRVTAWLRDEKGTAYWRNGPNATTVRDLHRSLATGLAEGETREYLRLRIIEAFHPLTGGVGIPAWRADLIARVEAGSAYEFGGHVTGEELSTGGVRIEKYWQDTGDGLTRDSHKAAGRRNGWIANSRRFRLGADEHLGPATLLYPADPGVSGDVGHIMDCRCTALRREGKRR